MKRKLTPFVSTTVVGLAVAAVAPFAAAASQTEQVTLQFLWPDYTPAKIRFGEYIVQAFEKENPNIKIEMILTNNPNQKLSVMAAGGAAPDVGWMGYGWKGIKDLWLPLDAYIARDRAEINPDDFVAPLWQSYKVGGKHYAMPLGYTATVLYHNLDHMSEVGLMAPSQNWTWNEFIDYARKLTRSRTGEKPYQWGLDLFHGGDYWPLFFYDGALWNADATKARFNTPARRFMLKERRDLIYTYGVHPDAAAIQGLGGSQPAFINGSTSIYAGGSWALEPVRLGAKFDWDIAPFPIANVEGRDYRGTGMWPEEMWVSAQTKHPEEAWKFVKFATGRGLLSWAAREGHIVPGRLSVGRSRDFVGAQKKPKHIEAFIASGSFATVYLDHAEGTRIGSAISPIIGRALAAQNALAPQAAAEEIDRVLQGILDDYNARNR